MTDLIIRQGSTFKRTIRAMVLPYIYKPITAITKAAPAQLTVPAHGMPDGWPAAIVSVVGMSEINTPLSSDGQPRLDRFNKATVKDTNTLEFNKINSSQFDTYVSGGYVQFFTPVNLTGAVARMTIKDKVGGTALVTLTNANGKIVLDTAAFTVSLLLSATETAAYVWKRAVYDLELQLASGEVLPLLEGTVTVTPEVTT